MKKTLLIGLSVGMLLLSGCWMKKALNPEEVLKETQANVVGKLFSTVFGPGKKEEIGTLTAWLDVNWDKIDVKLDIKWLADLIDENKSAANISGVVNLNTKEVTWKVNVNLEIITTLERLFFRLNSIDVNIPNPSLQAQVSMLKVFLGKWFYLDISKKIHTSNKAGKEELLDKMSLNKVGMKEIEKLLKENSLLKVTKVVWKRKYNVKLNHENIAKIIAELSNFTWDYEKIKQQLTGFDIDAVINIETDNLHFTLSGYLISEIWKEPFQLVYLKDKFKLELPDFKIDLDLKDSNYKGYVLAWKDMIQIKIPVEWKLSKNEFSFKLSMSQQMNQQSLNFFLNIDYKAKEIETVEIKIPENAMNIEEAMWTLLWLPR